jgi:hypothetical protein
MKPGSGVLSDASNGSTQYAGPEKELYDEMNEVISNVLSVTRALPTSKPSSSSHVIGSDSVERFHVDDRSDTCIVQEAESYLALTSPTLLGDGSMSIDRDVEQACDLLRHRIEKLEKSSSFNDVERSDHRSDSDSELSCLSRTPSLPDVVARSLEAHDDVNLNETCSQDRKLESKVSQRGRPARLKRKTTGSKSKHFSPVKRSLSDTLIDTPVQRIVKKEVESLVSGEDHPSEPETSAIVDIKEQPTEQATPKRNSTRLKRKTTSAKSDHFSPRPKTDPALFDRVDLYNPHGGTKRSTAGISTNPVPSILASRFGIVQERLWREPFWLIIAVVFLNQTTGRAAMPVFWSLKAKYSTIEAVANADVNELRASVEHLGLGNQRSKRIIAIAKLWLTNPPVACRRYRTLHYPSPGDGKTLKPDAVLEEDATLSPGALELGHMPGCKQYAYDSWRIFCRDVLRGVADDYRGLNAKKTSSTTTTTTADDGDGEEEVFEPEWKRVVPLDKELRACLRWMWLKEGFIWDPLTGGKRPATEEEMALAVEGQMEMRDEKERKFALQAVRNHATAAGDDDTAVAVDEVVSEEAVVVHDSEKVLDSSSVQ